VWDREWLTASEIGLAGCGYASSVRRHHPAVTPPLFSCRLCLNAAQRLLCVGDHLRLDTRVLLQALAIIPPVRFDDRDAHSLRLQQLADHISMVSLSMAKT
jgi:hypothetical protein